MKILRSLTTIAGFTMGSRACGFIRDMITAYLLGTGPMMDALVIAMKFPSLFRRILAEGAFNASFIPIFAGIARTKGKQEARAFAQEILAILLPILIILVASLVLLIPYLLPMIPGLQRTPERLQLAIEFSQITFPFILLISLTAFYSGILNSFERFAAVASSPMAGNIFVVCFALTLYPVFYHPGIVMASAILGCGVVQLLWVMVPCYKIGMAITLKRPRFTPRVMKLLARMGPAALGSGVHQINILIATLIATFLPVGGMSFLYYAERLTQLPLSVIGTAMSTVLLPLLSKQWRAGETKQAQASQNQGIEYALLLTMPATVGLICLAKPIISALFGHGKFDDAACQATAYALMSLACGLPAYVLTKIFNTSFYAQEDTKTPVICGIISVLVDILLSVILIRTLHQVGIGIATASAAWINVLLLAGVLWKRQFFSIDSRLRLFLSRLGVTCTGLVIYLEVTKPLVTPWMAFGWLYQTIALFVLIGGGIGLYMVVGFITKLFDTRELKSQFVMAKS